MYMIDTTGTEPLIKAPLFDCTKKPDGKRPENPTPKGTTGIVLEVLEGAVDVETTDTKTFEKETNYTYELLRRAMQKGYCSV